MEPGKPNWFVVVTKPRQEKIALANLQQQGFECFLPMAENPYQHRSRKHRRIIQPLFPRYLFLRAIADIQNLAPVRSTVGVFTMLRFGAELATVPEPIINAIKERAVLDSGLIKIHPVAINAGDKVRVFDGPLAGINGIVHERKGESRVLILMEILGRSTKVEVDVLQLQAAG